MLRWADLGQMLTQPHALPTSSRQGEKNKEKLMGQNKERERDYILIITMAKQTQLGAN